jgi:aspartate-semialdehyde dehydrogenase
MVGSVLMQRMREENDFAVINEPVFFTTSNVGGKGPDIGRDVPALKDAKNIDELKAMDAIVTCQGGDYTSDIYPKLRAAGWTATGSMRPPPCAWLTMPSSCWTRSTAT